MVVEGEEMTEDEAKTKWCPMVRWTKGGWSDDVYAAHNRYVDEKAEEQHGYNRCVASDCMMWIKTDNECEPKNGDDFLGAKDKCYPAGYCGLTNKWSR